MLPWAGWFDNGMGSGVVGVRHVRELAGGADDRFDGFDVAVLPERRPGRERQGGECDHMRFHDCLGQPNEGRRGIGFGMD
jgi:hypothetical protein